MPLHNTKDLKSDRTSASANPAAVNAAASSYKFPETSLDSQTVYQAIHQQLILDGDSQQNLATFCTTWIEPEVERLMDESADKNMIDKDEYPQTAAIEERCVHMLADLWNSPEAACTIGCSTTGSSEAAMLGGLALKWNWRKRRRAQGKSTDAPNLIMGPVQVCWHKFCRYFDVEIREVPMEGDRLLLTPEEVLKRCASRSRCNLSRSQPSAPRSTSLKRKPASRSPSTLTAPAARSWRPSRSPICCGTSACRASSPSTHRATSSASLLSESAGPCGARSTTCPKS